MSEIKALEDMRNTVKTIAADCDEGWILGCLDAIEAEITERFMELPVDADGVPIHVGDVMEYENPNDDDKPFTILGVNNDGDVFHCLEDKRLVPTCISLANCLRHVKPRTLEDALREFTEKYQYCISDNGRSITLAKYADEIRELLGVSE